MNLAGMIFQDYLRRMEYTPNYGDQQFYVLAKNVYEDIYNGCKNAFDRAPSKIEEQFIQGPEEKFTR